MSFERSLGALFAKRTGAACIVRNARLDSDWSNSQRRGLLLAVSAIEALMRSQGVGDICRTRSRPEGIT